MSCKDNKHHRKKQERFGDSSPTNFTDVHGFFNFQFSTFNFQFLRFKKVSSRHLLRLASLFAPLVLNSIMPLVFLA